MVYIGLSNKKTGVTRYIFDITLCDRTNHLFWGISENLADAHVLFSWDIIERIDEWYLNHPTLQMIIFKDIQIAVCLCELESI